MSRSYKKTPIFGNCAKRTSEKGDKKAWHKRFRRATKIEINVAIDIENLYISDYRALSNAWGFAKDGKAYDCEAQAEDLRK